jgi:thiosulfate dehydrogenase
MTGKIPAKLLLFTTGMVAVIFLMQCVGKNKNGQTGSEKDAAEAYWSAPDSNSIPPGAEGDLIRYGRNLIANTAFYFGPKGKIAHSSNGMNCQNCHLNAGTKPWGNNYGAVFSTYPKFRERRGAVESIVLRINDCFQRSLNGSPLDSNSREMLAILAYMKWLGKDVPKGKKPAGSGIAQLSFPDSAANQETGKLLYYQQCALCHGKTGQGLLNPDSATYLYPPLWGEHSYNTAAGLYRLSRFAGYVKDNMPFAASHQNSKLSLEEAWDLAAFVNSQPRPHIVFKEDWPDMSLKPVDHPFGPYTDSFSERQHKYGPLDPFEK